MALHLHGGKRRCGARKKPLRWMAEENPCVLFRTHGYKKTVQAKSGLSQRPAGNFSPLLQKEGIRRGTCVAKKRKGLLQTFPGFGLPVSAQKNTLLFRMEREHRMRRCPQAVQQAGRDRHASQFIDPYRRRRPGLCTSKHQTSFRHAHPHGIPRRQSVCVSVFCRQYDSAPCIYAPFYHKFHFRLPNIQTICLVVILYA